MSNEAVSSILDNYRAMIENRGHEYPDKDSVSDILKAFVIYSSGIQVRRISLIGFDEANDILNSAAGAYAPIDGFHWWKGASSILHGLMMLEGTIGNRILLGSLIKHLAGTSFLTPDASHEMAILGDSVCELISSKTSAPTITLNGWFLDLILNESGHEIIVDGPDNGIARCLSILTGAKMNADQASDYVICSLLDEEEIEKIEKHLDSSKKGSKTIIVTGRKVTDDPTLHRFRSSMEEHRVISISKLISPISDDISWVVEMGRGAPGMTLFDTISNGKTVRSESRPISNGWHMTGSVLDVGLETVYVGQIADIRRGVIVGSEDLETGSHSGRPLYIRPMDVRYGEIDLSEMFSVSRPGVSLTEPDSVLVATQAPFGTSYVVRQKDFPCVASARFSVVRPKGDYDPDYIDAFFRSSLFKKEICGITEYETGFISVEDLSNMSIPKATMGEQEIILDRITDLEEQDAESISEVFIEILKNRRSGRRFSAPIGCQRRSIEDA